MKRTTSTDYRRPHRPALVRWTNLIHQAFPRVLGAASLSADALMSAAQRRAGYDHFGGDSFREPLERLSRAIEDEAALHPLGRWIMRQRLVGALATRLRVQRMIDSSPRIADGEVARPIIITGLQRSGTTLLHRLLAADTKNRALLSWEALNPAPLPLTLPLDIAGPDLRLLMARLSEHTLAFLAPDFFAIHPVEATAPEEDSLLLDFTFLSPVAEATLRVPSYGRWLEAQDLRPAYDYLALLLKVLEAQRQAERWVLKTPAHLESLDLLCAVFPEVTIVHTHRDPERTLPSFCSMIAHGRGVFSDAVDPHEIGQEWLRRQSRMVDRAIELRADPAINERVIDISYASLVRDPLTSVRRIYEFAQVPLDGRTEAAIRAAREKNPQHKHGRHDYKLEDFGLDAAQVQRAFARYRGHHAALLEEGAR